MLPIVAGAAIAGGASLLGGIAQGIFGSSAQSSANEANALEARKNRTWQTYMSNTAYQRASNDMRNAGINPMLAYTQGGASTPSGATASAGAYQPEDVIGKGVQSAMEMMRYKKDLEVADSQVTLNQASKVKQMADAKLSEQSAKLASSQQDNVDADTATKNFNFDFNKNLAEVNIDAAARDALARSKEASVRLKSADFDDRNAQYNNINRMIQTGLSSAQGAKDLLSPAAGLIKNVYKLPESKGYQQTQRNYQGPTR